ncbi:MAG: hypothetical protein B7Y45_01895 [Sphingomonas sp. 28-66-16]|nr:MAG: hypothetical protein B7Y45_01895 [Sphingomonas sp. 28-66-16]
MSDPDTTARNRYFLMTGARLCGAAGAVFGVLLLGRAQTLDLKILGAAIVVSALVVMALLPRALAQRWRTPPEP